MRDIKNYVEILDLGDGKSDDVIKRKSEKKVGSVLREVDEFSVDTSVRCCVF